MFTNASKMSFCISDLTQTLDLPFRRNKSFTQTSKVGERPDNSAQVRKEELKYYSTNENMLV